MSKVSKIGILIIAVILLLNVSSAIAISKVTKKVNFVEFYGTYSHPIGTYESIGVGSYEIPFENSMNRIFKLDAVDVYDGSYGFGINYGQIQGNKMFSLGFGFTEIKHDDTFLVDDVVHWYNELFESPTFRLYDLNLNFNYYLADPTRMGLSPYLGAGFKAGFLNASTPGAEAENDITFSLGINFGADITFWESANKRSFIALSSKNQFQFLNSSVRSKFFNFGAALKYYFRP